ncbi:nuclear transport factor 2 family protein [Sphingomonas koreensis]
MSEVGANQEIVSRFFESAGKGDFPGALALIDDNCVWTYNASTDFVPFAGTFNGKAGVASFFQGAAQYLRIDGMEVESVETIENRVLVRGQEICTVNATGDTYRAGWLHVVRIEGGLIVGYDEYVDSAVIAKALGTLRLPG